VAFYVVAAVVVAVAFPHAKLYIPRSGAEDSMPLFFAGLASLALVVPGLMMIPRVVRERREHHLIAAARPTCNPWRGVEQDPRSRWSAPLAASVPNLLWLLGFIASPSGDVGPDDTTGNVTFRWG
jgi:hypothetical protein